MIICAEGFDDETRKGSHYFKIAVDSKDILYFREKNNWQTVFYLRYNYTHTENIRGEESQLITNPVWVVLNMPIEDVIKKLEVNI